MLNSGCGFKCKARTDDCFNFYPLSVAIAILADKYRQISRDPKSSVHRAAFRQLSRSLYDVAGICVNSLNLPDSEGCFHAIAA
jgi:hypothetical protein